MFDLSIEKIVVLLLVALFVLGPERLPAAAAWLGRTIRQLKTYLAGANEHVRSELGPEFDEIRKPLEELRGPLHDLRALRYPRTTLTRALFDLAPPPTPTTLGDLVPTPFDEVVPTIPVPAAMPPPRPPGRPPTDPEAT